MYREILRFVFFSQIQPNSCIMQIKYRSSLSSDPPTVRRPTTKITLPRGARTSTISSQHRDKSSKKVLTRLPIALSASPDQYRFDTGFSDWSALLARFTLPPRQE